MKRFALTVSVLAASAASAFAADLPVYTKAPLVAPVAVYSWTGCYIGGNGGGLWVRKDWRATTTQAVVGSHDADGGMGGVQAGCNYQTGHFVFGIQGDYDGTNASGSSPDQTIQGRLYDRSQIDGLGSVTGRVGYAMDRFLIYVKGGVAWERDRYSTYFGPLTTQPGVTLSTASETRQGATVGFGGEYAFWKSLSVFLEYDYYDFGTKTNTFTLVPPFTGPQDFYDIRERKSVVKAGLNWKFDWAQPVVAKY
jgi:outer membrane immunogenic protein